MSVYLGYSYSSCLTEKEKSEIDKKVKKNQKEFFKGFKKGTQISLSIYSVYLLVVASAYAADSCPNPNESVPAKNGAAAPAPTNKPGYKPLSDSTKGAFVGGGTAICGAAIQSGDFILGFCCAGLLVAAGILINRPNPN